MPSDDFPTAPDAKTEFFNNRLTPESESKAQRQQQQQQPTHDDSLDHPELTLDLTPGGQLEQDVHTQLSEQARSEYKNRKQQTEPTPEKDYLDQVQDRFNKQLEAEEKKQEAELRKEEQQAKLLKLFKEKQQEYEAKQGQNANAASQNNQTQSKEQKDWKAASYDMPEQEDKANSPHQHSTTSGGARPRPGRSERSDREPGGGGHEH